MRTALPTALSTTLSASLLTAFPRLAAFPSLAPFSVRRFPAHPLALLLRTVYQSHNSKFLFSANRILRQGRTLSEDHIDALRDELRRGRIKTNLMLALYEVEQKRTGPDRSEEILALCRMEIEKRKKRLEQRMKEIEEDDDDI